MLCTPIKLYKQFDKTFKSPTLCLKKFKCWCSYIGTLTQVPTKFYEIQSSRFKEDMLTNCSSRLSFNIAKIPENYIQCMQHVYIWKCVHVYTCIIITLWGWYMYVYTDIQALFITSSISLFLCSFILWMYMVFIKPTIKLSVEICIHFFSCEN